MFTLSAPPVPRIAKQSATAWWVSFAAKAFLALITSGTVAAACGAYWNTTVILRRIDMLEETARDNFRNDVEERAKIKAQVGLNTTEILALRSNVKADREERNSHVEED